MSLITSTIKRMLLNVVLEKTIKKPSSSLRTFKVKAIIDDVVRIKIIRSSSRANVKQLFLDKYPQSKVISIK